MANVTNLSEMAFDCKLELFTPSICQNSNKQILNQNKNSPFDQFNCFSTEIKELHLEKYNVITPVTEAERKQKVLETELIELKDLVTSENTKSRIAVTFL